MPERVIRTINGDDWWVTELGPGSYELLEPVDQRTPQEKKLDALQTKLDALAALVDGMKKTELAEIKATVEAINAKTAKPVG